MTVQHFNGFTPLPPYPTPEMPDDDYNAAAYATTEAYPGMIAEMTQAAAVVENNANFSEQQAGISKAAALTAAERLIDVQTAANGAFAAANYKGEWSTLTGALAVPATVTHLGRLWYLKANLANVASQTPALGSTYWGEVSRNDFAVLPCPAGNTNAADRGFYRMTAATSVLVLPAAPFHGMVIAAANVSGTLTPLIQRNGKTICGDAEDYLMNQLGWQIVLQYDSGSGDWLRVSGVTAFTPYSTNQPFNQANNWPAAQAFSALTVGGKTVQQIVAEAGSGPETGKGVDGWWEKYPDGRLECGITMAVPSGAQVAASNYLAVGTWTYPVAAVSLDDMSIVTGAFASNMTFVVGALNPTTTSTSVRIFNGSTSSQNRPTHVSLRMKGWWK